MNRLVLSSVVIIWLSFPVQNLVAAPAGWKENVHLLPQYCKDRATAKGNPQDPWAKWRRTFGKTYIHIHHYCNGSYAEQKAKLTANKKERLAFLGKVIGEMRYVSPACSKECVLYPELHSRWGWALGEQGKVGEAIKHYQQAIRVKKTYTKAYAGLSDLFVKANQHDEARKVLKEGLAARPKSRMLQRRLQKLNKTNKVH